MKTTSNNNHRRHIAPSHYVAILGSTNKTEMSRIGNWIFVMSRGKGCTPRRLRDALANASGSPTVDPWIFTADPPLRLRIGYS